MSIHDRDYYRDDDDDYEPRQYRNNRNDDWGWWRSPKKSSNSPFQIFIVTLTAIVIGSVVLWFVRVAYVQWVLNRFQQQVMASVQNYQQNALAQQAHVQQEQRQRMEAARQWKQDHPTMRLAGYEKVWVPGKPLEQCKKPGQVFDNATVACINGYYENHPVYVKE
jgi:hypothetical protein